jgi:TonB-linked SusC/RagA family outer membrane protein
MQIIAMKITLPVISFKQKMFTLIFLVLLGTPFLGFSQDKIEMKGYVKDIEGNPVQGVFVTKRKTEKGAITDEKGYFTLKTSDASITLLVSHIGYATKQVKTDGKTELVIVLERVVANQEDVVVIGYGSSKRKDVTGAISTFKPKRNDAQQFGSVDNLMKGRIAGVQVQQSGGDPGGAVSVKIRGLNSLRGNNEPLYVVDGVIINNVTLDAADPFSAKTANSGQSQQSGLTGINPQDIESIDVLKDASATAIYGSRGANGVVIITTKKGKGKPVIMYSSYIEFAKASRHLNVLDARGYASYINEIEALNGRPAKYGLDTLKPADWQNELMQSAITHNNRLSISGSSADNKTKYFIAGGFLNNEGIVQRSGYKQGDIKINLEQELSSKIKMHFTLSGVYLKNSMSQSTEPLGGGDNSMIIKMLVGNPIRNAIADLTDPTTPYDNPLSWLQGYDDLTEEKRLINGLGFTYKIANWLSYKINAAVDFRSKERKRWFGKQTFQGKNANGSLGLSQLERKFYQIENLFLFNKKLNKQNLLEGTLGFTYDNENIVSSSVINENFFSEELRTDGFGFGQLIYPYIRDKVGAKVFSVLGRINYSYADKYIVTLSGRTDGSSKFAKGNKFSLFPAIAAAWKVSNEKFMNTIHLISNLKVRVGYGKSGNQAIDPYGTFARYGQTFYVNGNTLVSGAVPLNIQNKNLKWETTDQFNSGLDVNLFKNRITFNTDLYYKKTKDLLQTFVIPASTGYQVIPKNIGTIENKGVEFTLGALVLSKKALTLNLSANIGINRNKIIDLGLPEAQFGINTWEAYIGPNVSTGTYFKDPANVFVVGQPIGMFYGYKTNGVFQTGENLTGITQFGLPVQYGDLKIVDQNADKDINPDDKVILGNPNPKFVYGFTTSLVYKDWSFDVFFNGSYGAQVANGNLMRLANANGVTANNILADAYYNAWTAAKGGNSPRVGYNNLSFIDRYVEDASYLRLATVALGYTLNFKNPKLIKSINFSLSGKNLLTVTGYSGFDPEVNSFSFDKGKIGVDWGSYPNLRSFSAGINLTF